MLLDGKTLSERIFADIAREVKSLSRPPKLHILLVGNDEASQRYVRIKELRCKGAGIRVEVTHLGEDANNKDVFDVISQANDDSETTGILVQLPLPKHLDTRSLLDTISPDKDVDGLTSHHLSRLLLGQDHILSATPRGILMLLDEYNIPLEGADVCIVGFGNTVGKPLAFACSNRGATITICRSRTKDLAKHTKNADIIVMASGKPLLLTADMLGKESTVVDVGNHTMNGKLVGEVDPSVKGVCKNLTPVPGGVGPMTIVALLTNLLEAHKAS